MQGWTWNDYDVLAKNFPTMGIQTIGLLEGKRFPNMMDKVTTMQLKMRANPTAEQERYVKEYADVLGTALIFLMPCKTVGEVEEYIECIGK